MLEAEEGRHKWKKLMCMKIEVRNIVVATVANIDLTTNVYLLRVKMVYGHTNDYS